MPRSFKDINNKDNDIDDDDDDGDDDDDNNKERLKGVNTKIRPLVLCSDLILYPKESQTIDELILSNWDAIGTKGKREWLRHGVDKASSYS